MPKSRSAGLYNIIILMTVYLFFFMIKSPLEASEAVRNAVKLCAEKVIPSLFPFLVLSDIAVNTSLSSLLGNGICRPLSFLFGTPQNASAALIAGNLFGFPIGTKTVVSLFEQGEISKKDTKRMICFCSNAGLGFVVGFIGSALGNVKIAVCIYCCQLISALLISIILRKKHTEILNEPNSVSKNFSPEILTKAVTSSVLPMLNICAFVCFFACISSSVDNALSYFHISEYTSALVTGVLELTNGISRVSELPINALSVGMCSFFTGFSGISVILQSMSITSKYEIKMSKFVFFKMIQGVFSAFLCVIVCKLLKLY